MTVLKPERWALPQPMELTRDNLEQLAAMRTERPVIVTLYVRLAVQDRIRNRYRLALREMIRQAVHATAELPHAEREALERDLKRVRHYLEGRMPQTPGLAVFACESLGLFRVIALPRVLQPRLLVGQRPRLAEAQVVLEGFSPILVAAVDRTHARFFEVNAFEATELASLALPATRGGKFHSDRADAPGWGEYDYHNRIREERHRHAVQVAQHLAMLVAQRPTQGIVLAGPGRVIADQLRFLPRDVSRKVLGTMSMNPTAVTTPEIRQAALACHTAWAREQEVALVEQLDEASGEGWAVNGAQPVLRALARGQVRRLLIPADQAGSGYRCGESGRLVLAKGDCRGEGDPLTVPDLVNEVIEEALHQRVDLELLEDQTAIKRVDGLAAFLRFR